MSRQVYLYVRGYKDCKDKKKFISLQSKQWKHAQIVVHIADQIRRFLTPDFNNEDDIVEYYHEYCMN